MIRIEDLVGRLLSWSARFISGTSARWVNCGPSTRQRIYYGNHSSHLDIVILWSSLPREVRRLTRPAAARDYWEKSTLRRYLAHKVFNAIMIDRSEHGGSLRDARRAIDNTIEGMGDTHSLIIFPEGTRGEGTTVAPFKSGLYYLSKRLPGIEVVPVYMENLNRILPKGEFFPIPLVSSISFGASLTLGDGESKQEFLERARQAILRLKE